MIRCIAKKYYYQAKKLKLKNLHLDSIKIKQTGEVTTPATTLSS